MKDAYYFPHDSNAKDDPKMMLVIDELGPAGYGMYWMLIEELRNQPGYKYPIRVINTLARKFNAEKEEMIRLVNDYDLFVIDNDMFYSESLIRRMEVFEAKRKRRVEAGRKGGKTTQSKKQNLSNNQALLNQQSSNALSEVEVEVKQSVSNDKASKVKESKVKESKETKEVVYPSFDEFKEYALEKAVDVGLKIDSKKLHLKFLAWSENNWENGNGKKIIIWKTTLLNTLKYLESDDNTGSNTNGPKSSTPSEKIEEWTY